MRILTVVSTLAIWSVCWFAVAGDSTKDATANTATRQDGRILFSKPDFVSTTNGQINIPCVSCGHTHTDRFWRVESVDVDELAHGKEMLGRELSKYPISVITANVDRIYLLRKLANCANGEWVQQAGVCAHRSLYLAQQIGKEWFHEAVVHHELCHLLQFSCKPRFPDEAWCKCNPEGFSYPGSPPIDSPVLGEQYLKDGFVCSHGRSSWQEDVCTYAMWLFTRSDWMFKQASQYPRVKAKLDILVAFYGNIDPVFTVEYFRGNCQTQPPSGDMRRSARRER